jgi:hypothetical protein
MRTSEQTRKYWVEAAKGWAEGRLPPPQLDEFNQVMDELLQEVEVVELQAERIRSLVSEVNRLGILVNELSSGVDMTRIQAEIDLLKEIRDRIANLNYSNYEKKG